MKENMKKIYLFLLAAAGILAVASCAREELFDNSNEANAPEEVTTLTFSFDATKTALVNGKTVWEEGDKIRVYTSDGGFYKDVEVPAEAIGQSSFSAEVNLKDTLFYAVYPVEASKGIVEGKVVVNLPKNPDGRFASANICVASTKGSDFQFQNVTAVLKINVNSSNVVEMVQIIAKNAIVGDYAIGFAKDTLNFTATSTAKSLTVAVGGVDGEYYIPVIPGKYEKEFSVTALRGNGGYQNKKTTVDNVVKVNTLFDLGIIGDNLTDGLEGKGTEDEPFTISNDAEMLAFTKSVTMGKTYAGEIVSLNEDIVDTPVSEPAGYWLSNDDQGYFAGTFLGNNHTIDLNIEGENAKDAEGETYVALFAVVGENATIKDLKVTGSVKAKGNYTAGIIGYVRGVDEKEVTITNLTNEASVTSTGNQVGGVVAYATYADIHNCTNKGVINGGKATAGIIGYSYKSIIRNCSNEAAISSTFASTTAMYANEGWTATSGYENGIGGIAGWAQNSSVEDCTNSANVTGYTKVGGIIGTAYWTPSKNLTNSGNVEATGNFEYSISSQMGYGYGSVAGGVIGWLMANGDIENAKNSGTVKGKGGIGGIIGNVTADKSNTGPVVTNCHNTGDVIAANVYTGGGLPWHNAATGGVVGALMGNTDKAPKLIGCSNKGNVTSDSRIVGGIVGNVMRLGKYTSWNQIGYPTIDQCVNEGNVTGTYYVGGIVGLSHARVMTRLDIKNCANHGAVTGSTCFTDDKKIDYAGIGGLVGEVGTYTSGYQNNNNNHLRIYNSYNDGDVLYKDATLVKPYAGGIVGNANAYFTIENTYNFGFVGPESKVAPADGALARMGELLGYQYADSHMKFSYYKVNGSVAQPVGTAKTTTVATVTSFDDAGDLAAAVTANSISCTTLMQALNEWQNYYVNYNYFNWTGAANHPVHDTTMN